MLYAHKLCFLPIISVNLGRVMQNTRKFGIMGSILRFIFEGKTLYEGYKNEENQDNYSKTR